MTVARVSPREHDLLLVARALVGEVPRAVVEPLLLEARPLPARLGPTAARLLKETLAVGCVRALMRRGGWRRSVILDGERTVRGRAWERTPPPPLGFSPLSMHVCRFLVGEALGDPQATLRLPPLPPTLADEIVLYLAHDLLGPALAERLARQPSARASVLCRLAYPALGDDGALPALEVGPWLSAGGAVVVAALAPDLAGRWIAEARRRERAPADRIATAFLDACDALGRRDLADFVVEAGRELLRDRDPRRVAARLAPEPAPSTPLSVRQAAREAAGSPLRAFLRVGRWQAEHRLVRHFDDGYVAAQHLLLRWEDAAPLFPVAEAALHHLDALDATVAGGPAP